MGTKLPPEARPMAREELAQRLSELPIATLRQIARGWGWPIKGAAKAEITAQLANYMSDEDRMSAAYRSLSSREQDVLAWTIRLSGGWIATTLAACLAYPAEREVPQTEVLTALRSLVDRGLLFVDQYQTYTFPLLAQEWIPDLDAPWLRHNAPPGAVTPFSLADINRHLHHLLSSVEIDRPLLPAIAQVTPPNYRNAVGTPGGEAVTSRPGLVSAESLASWGYHTTEERNRARFLLQQMLAGGLLRAAGSGNQQRLQGDEKAQLDWEQLHPIDRLNRIRSWWLGPMERVISKHGASWNELDIALQSIKNYQLRTGVWWGGMEQFVAPVLAARMWMLRLLLNIAPDNWMSFEALARLVWRVKPDLLSPEHDATQRQWYEGDQPLPARNMPFDVWSATHGRLLQAFITGPAAWLGFVELGRQQGEPVCFRRLSVIDVSDIQRLPADLLQFPGGDAVVLRSAWQAGAVRPLLNRIAIATARDRATTTYRLDAATFRRTLENGESTQDVAGMFAAGGLSLPPAMAAKLAAWEGRAGNHLIQEAVAAIEFGEDMAPAEVQALAALGGSRVYQAAPRCLVVLDAADVPGLVDELRRRGYTPQVVS